MIFLLWNRGAGARTPRTVVTYLGVPYTHTTMGTAISMLANRLQDAGYRYWAQAEMRMAIVDALRMWQSITTAYRERAEFSIQAGDGFLNLHTLIPTRLGFTVTDTDITKQVQYSLLEPPTGLTWTGTAQFTSVQVSEALQRRKQQFLLDTGMVQTYTQMNVQPMPVGRIPLQDSVVDVRRVAWISAAGVYTPIWRDDEFSRLSFDAGWMQTPGLPDAYSVSVTPPVSLQLLPASSDSGGIETITVNSTSSIPDDFNWAIRFGVLADLLSADGLGRDRTRAEYCEQMYGHGVEIAKISPCVLMAQINDEPLYTGSVFELDSYQTDWQNAPGKPWAAAMSGRNLLTYGPVPNGQYGATLDFVPNMPIPATDAEFVQVGRECLEAILDCAQHLCSFKQGGQDFLDSVHLFQNFVRICGVQNSRMTATAFYRKMIEAPALTQMREVARLGGTKPNDNVNANIASASTGV